MDPTNRSPLTSQEQPQVPMVDHNGVNTPTDDDYDRLFTWERMRGKIEEMIKEWWFIKKKIMINRSMRKIEVDYEALRTAGYLKPDETLIPIHIVDENIRKEQPQYMQYLVGPEREAVFTCINDPTQNTEQLETEYTKGMRYAGHEIPKYKCLDGSQAHGYDWLKVEYDDTKPFKINFYHIGSDKLLFNLTAKDLQAEEVVALEHDISILQLDKFVKDFGFDKQQVENIKNKFKTKEIRENITIYEVMFKWLGYVYVGWSFTEGNSCTDWLKKPQQLWLGVKNQQPQTTLQTTIDPTTGMPIQIPVQTMVWVDEYETQYPIETEYYEESEEEKIVEHKGRCFKDQSKQEAQTALWSLYINGAVRASNVYGSPEVPSGSGAPPKRLELSLEHGCFYSEPMRFWNTPYPSPEILRAADSLDVRTQAEQGRIAESVINRNDARKTAAEIKTAKSEEDELATVDLMLFQVFWRNLHTRIWRIVRSLALQGEIPLLVQQVLPNGKYQNDVQRLSLQYDIRPAGDIDLVKRKQQLQARMQLLQIVQGIPPLALQMILDILRDALPQDFPKYMQTVAMFMQQQQMMAQSGQQPQQTQQQPQNQNNGGGMQQ
jgi:hypothetical protein